MKLIKAVAMALIEWQAARHERRHLARVEHELQIQRELDYVQSRLGENSYKVLTSQGITEAVSDDFFRRVSS